MGGHSERDPEKVHCKSEFCDPITSLVFGTVRNSQFCFNLRFFQKMRFLMLTIYGKLFWRL